MKNSYLALIFTTALLVACTSGTEEVKLGSSKPSSSVKNAAIAPTNRVSAMCIGNPGCNFGDSHVGNPDNFDRQLADGIRSGQLKGTDLRGYVFSGDRRPLKVAMADLTDATFGSGNFSGSNLMDATLVNAKFGGATDRDYGVNFSNSNFAFTKLSGAIFERVDLSQSVMIYADLSNASLVNVQIDGLDLGGANLEGVYSLGLVGKPYLPEGWKLINGRLVGPGARLAYRERVTQLLESTSQLGFGYESTEVRPSTIGPNSSCPNLWAPTDVRMITNGGKLQTNEPGADAFAGADLSFMDLRNADFSDLNLSRTNFEGSKLDGARFVGANLAGANFKQANLKGNDFSGARLVSTNFTAAFIALLRSGCTDVDSMTLKTIPDYQYQRSDGIVKILDRDGNLVSRKIRYGVLFGRNVDLSGKNLAGLSTMKVDLSQANFAGVSSGAVEEIPIFSPTLSPTAALWPEKWSVINGILMGPGVDLSFSNVSRINFGKNCEWLKTARLDGIKSGQTLIEPFCALPRGWVFASGYLVGPRVNLDGVILSGQNLDGAHLVNVSLNKTSLIGASLMGVKGRDISGSPILPIGWDLLDGNLVGSNADLTGVQIDIRESRLSRTSSLDFSKATLLNSAITGIPLGTRMPFGYKVVRDSASTSVIGPDAVLPCSLRVTPSDVVGVTLPKGAVVLDGRLIGPNCSYSNDSKNVVGSLDQVDLSGVMARMSDFSRVTFRKVKGVGLEVGALPRNWSIRQGILVGPTADLSNLDLSRVDLRGVDLSSAVMNGAFGRFVQIDALTRLPTGWGVVNNYLVGPKADLSRVLIIGGNFTSVSLVNANVIGARIFSSRGLSGTQLQKAVILDGTVVYDGADLACAQVDSRTLSAQGLGRNAKIWKAEYPFGSRISRLKGNNQCG